MADELIPPFADEPTAPSVDEPSTPFEGLESAQEYIGLLCEALKEARRDVQEDLDSAIRGDATRRVDALRLVGFKLDRLESNLENSRRILGDLRKLRRLLLSEPR